MAATNATLFAIGQKTGKTYAVDLYVPDAVSTKVCWNPNGLAASTSETYWSAPENVIIIDISAVGAPTAVGGNFTFNGAVANGNTFRWANQANTLSNRAKMTIPVNQGTQIGILQY